MKFFTKHELNTFNKWASKKYDSFDKEHIKASFTIRQVWYKVEYWASLVSKVLEYDYSIRCHWNQVTGGGMIFRRYAWSQVYDPKYADIKVFFSLEVMKGVYFVKLDHKISGKYALSDDQKSKIMKYMDENLVHKTIDHKEINDWDDLVKFTVDFLSSKPLYKNYYDALKELVISNNKKEPLLIDRLNYVDYEPVDYPERRAKYTGKETDYIAKSKRLKDIGNKGESMTLNLLKSKGYKVTMADHDSDGYDIKAKKGKEILLVEVKTTTRGRKEPFYLTRNELKTCEKNTGSYLVYRIYNFNEIRLYGDYNIITGESLLASEKDATTYKVYW